MFEGLVRQRYPDLDFQSAAQPFPMAEMVNRPQRPMPLRRGPPEWRMS
jgi:hypothetical protein